MTPSSGRKRPSAILKQNGYATSWFARTTTPSYQYSLSGPFDQWRAGWASIISTASWAKPTSKAWLFRDHTQIFPWLDRPGHNLTTGMADDAIRHIKGLNATAPDQPFFVYYAPVAHTRCISQPRSGSTSSKASSTWAGTRCASRYSRTRSVSA